MKTTKTPHHLSRIYVALSIIFIIVLAYILIGSIQQPITNTNQPVGGNDNWKTIEKNMVTLLQEEKVFQPQKTPLSPVLGKDSAPIKIFEFSSFGCPHSKEIQSLIKNILKQYPNDVQLIWKDLPIPTFENAPLAHRAARCAQQQNKFWEFHDALWASDKINTSTIDQIGSKLKLDQKKFDTCLSNNSTQSLINQDIKEADDLLISGTPHIYINDKDFMGTITQEDIERTITNELKKK